MTPDDYDALLHAAHEVVDTNLAEYERALFRHCGIDRISNTEVTVAKARLAESLMEFNSVAKRLAGDLRSRWPRREVS